MILQTQAAVLSLLMTIDTGQDEYVFQNAVADALIMARAESLISPPNHSVSNDRTALEPKL